jgi:hypothetical protein
MMYFVWKNSDDGDVFRFSPRVMHWDEDTWISDLRFCQSFWKQPNIMTLWHAHLRTITYGVFCEHPWKGLFLLHYREAHAASGIVDLSCDPLWEKADWQSWFALVPTAAKHYKYSLKNQQKPWLALMKKIGLTPFQSQHIKQEDIQRRFGSFLAELWGFTYKPRSLDGFPWQNHQVVNAH